MVKVDLCCIVGTFAYENKDTYEGQWLDDFPNGIGTFTYANGSKYKGNLIMGKRQGKGK
jgi:hypothetical protein